MNLYTLGGQGDNCLANWPLPNLENTPLIKYNRMYMSGSFIPDTTDRAEQIWNKTSRKQNKKTGR